MKVFLSHSESDMREAKGLAEALRRDGYWVWDGTDIQPGEFWAQEVASAMRAADTLIVLVSKESASSRWIRNEIVHALGSARFENRVIPVYLDDVPPPVWPLADVASVRGRGAPAWSEVRKRLSTLPEVNAATR